MRIKNGHVCSIDITDVKRVTMVDTAVICNHVSLCSDEY